MSNSIKKEDLIAEIEQFKEEALKMHIVEVLADSYTNTSLFDYVILEREDKKIWWMKTQAYQLWCFWKAAKAQAVPEGFLLMPRQLSLQLLQVGEPYLTTDCLCADLDQAYSAIVEAQEQGL